MWPLNKALKKVIELANHIDIFCILFSSHSQVYWQKNISKMFAEKLGLTCILPYGLEKGLLGPRVHGRQRIKAVRSHILQ